MFSLVVKQLFENPCFGPWVSVETNNKILFVVLALLSRSDVFAFVYGIISVPENVLAFRSL
jgi:hypothetical protein